MISEETRYVNYCYIAHEALFEKNEVTEITVEQVHEPAMVYTTPDMVLRCLDCAALVPWKHIEKHDEFHNRLNVYMIRH